jgi:hypothetical protein
MCTLIYIAWNIASVVKRGLSLSDIFPTSNKHRYAAEFSPSKGHIQRLSHCQIHCKKKKVGGGGEAKYSVASTHQYIVI